MTSSLDDIEPPNETVMVGDKPISVCGLPMRIVTKVVRENPAFIGFITGGGLTAEAIIEEGPKAVPVIIAAGFGKPDDESEQKKAGNLPMNVQIDLIAGILKATLGGGMGPFVASLKNLREAATAGLPVTQEELAAKTQAKIQKLRQKQSATPPPSSLNSSSPTDIPAAISGR